LKIHTISDRTKHAWWYYNIISQRFGGYIPYKQKNLGVTDALIVNGWLFKFLKLKYITIFRHWCS